MRLLPARALAPLALVTALLLSGCSGTDDAGASSDPGASASAGETAAAAAADTASTTATPEPTPTSTPTVDPAVLEKQARQAKRQAKAAKRAAKVAQRKKLVRKAQRQARRVVARNPLAGSDWGVYHGDADQAWAPYTRSGGTDRALLSQIVEQPKAQWFGDWIGDAEIGAKVRDYIANAQDGDPDKLVQMAVFRMQPWEHEACGRLPSAAEQASYKRWIDAFAAAVGDTPAAIILQPDGPFALCVPGGSPVPSGLIAYSARVFGALDNTATYIDAGAADWPAAGQGGVEQVLKFLIPAGVEDVRGIALNSTHYSATSDEVVRGAEIIEALAARGITGKHLVVNTSSNGRPFVFGDAPGSDPDHATVCPSASASHCVTLGIPPTTEVADPAWGLSDEVAALATKYADGYLWFGRPWLYRQNSPFDLGRALQLARTTPY